MNKEVLLHHHQYYSSGKTFPYNNTQWGMDTDSSLYNRKHSTILSYKL